jgi:hypothetical protein
MGRQKKDPDPARWDSGQKLKALNTRILCLRCGVLRQVRDWRPLAKVAVLAECGHERRI